MCAFLRPALGAVSLCFTAAVLPAQGTYKTLGSGCSTSGVSTYSANPKGGTLSTTTLVNEYAFPIKKAATAVTVVTGVRFYTKSVSGTRTVGVRLYPPDPLNKAQPSPTALDATKITVGPVPRFYQASFNKVHIMKGPFWISCDNVETFTATTVGPAAVYATNLATGTPVTGVYWRRPPVFAKTWSLTGIIKIPSYHVMSGGGQMPILSAAKGPTLGQVFQLDLSQSRANRPAIAAFGFSNTKFGAFTLPLDLTPIAPGCFLFQSLDILLPGTLLPGNKAKALLPIPNNTQLKGATFYNQWLIFEPGGNALNWLFSSAGQGTIG